MNILENTVSMMKALPEADLIKIQDFAKKLFRQRHTECPLPLLSEADIMQTIETSEQQIANGEWKRAEEFMTEIRHEYGI